MGIVLVGVFVDAWDSSAVVVAVKALLYDVSVEQLLWSSFLIMVVITLVWVVAS